jgi:predicted SAM-dependent methyltransferase
MLRETQNHVCGSRNRGMSVEKIFLHVGCGLLRKGNTTRGFNSEQWREIRLDIDPSVTPDIIGTMTDMSAVETASVDAVFSSHNIEHLYPHEVLVALAEFLRVLKDDGFAVITCPDLKSVAKRIADDLLLEPVYQSGMGPIAPLDLLYGHRASLAKGNLYMAHRCGFTQKVLAETLQAVGFKSVASACIPQSFVLWAFASKSERDDAELRELARLHFP